jgi:hypothetical protein
VDASAEGQSTITYKEATIDPGSLRYFRQMMAHWIEHRVIRILL